MFCCSVPKPSPVTKIREFPPEYCRVMGLPRTELAWPNWVSWPPSQEEKEREKQLSGCTLGQDPQTPRTEQQRRGGRSSLTGRDRSRSIFFRQSVWPLGTSPASLPAAVGPLVDLGGPGTGCRIGDTLCNLKI